MTDIPVLIAGAGPTGLVLALSLAHQGIPCRIIDQAKGPGEASRAMVLQARTLEFYRALGIDAAVIEAGMKVQEAHIREEHEEVARLPLGDFGAGLSRYPFVLAFPQDDHERLLADHLARAGVTVEWNTALAGFTETPDGIRATLRHGGAEVAATAAYLVGCDGAHSRVRQVMGVGFAGGTYSQRFYVADATVKGGFRDDLHVNLAAGGLALMFPVRKGTAQRLLGVVPAGLDARESLEFEDIRPAAEALLGVRVSALHWFSTYHVHHRVASRFRLGRAFLAGDAGHLHSPAGGQGMNTGIGDAVNLAWKLAAVVRGTATPAILDTYEAERIGFARSLVATTDRIFEAMVSRGPGGRFLRHWLIPHLAPAVVGLRRGQRAFFNALSQIRIAYPDSALSQGRAGDVAGGARLPWVEEVDNFAPLDGRGWRLQVHGAVAPDLAAAAAARRIPLDRFPWTAAAERAGLARDAAYLLRPDGHVGLADPGQDPARLAAYAADQGLDAAAVA